MEVASLALRSPIADTLDEIFEPVRFETLADVFEQYAEDRRKLEEISAMFGPSNTHLVEHFVRANSTENYVPLNPQSLFQLEPGVKALDAEYWSKALALTDVLESMPQKRRSEWHDLVRSMETPPFNKTTVISTLQDLLVQRHKFFAERVDGVFRMLSPDHVTNRPEGFSKRMIINYVYNGGFVDLNRSGYINDLRCVIARFMGREEPGTFSTRRSIEYARQEHVGQWVSLDGGALRIRLYKKGTAHLEVHPDMSWRLNNVLASLYPNAIPESHRRRPKSRAPKGFPLISRPLPTLVLELLMRGRLEGSSFRFEYDARKSPAYEEACQVLETLGGVSTFSGYDFDYDAHSVLRQVLVSGVLPDQKSHQYYPTPRDLAQRVVAEAGITGHMTVLEPSAGQGALAEFLPKDRTVLVEVSALHCEVLRSKGFESVVKEDFLTWNPGRRFDRIVMNPPFSKGRWVRHVEHAASLLSEGGKLVSVLPVGARGSKDLLPGMALTWSNPEPFPGTSIEVAMLTAEHLE